MNIGLMENVKYDESGLVPVVATDAATEALLMLAYANEEALRLSASTGCAWFFSRSRGRLWKKGEASGNVLKIVDIVMDCDGDAVQYRVSPTGPVCHTGQCSCFHNIAFSAGPRASRNVLMELDQIIALRSTDDTDGSYTRALLQAGVTRISRKVGEEAVEVILAANSETPGRVVSEVADLLYHCLVLLHAKGKRLSDLLDELATRRK